MDAGAAVDVGRVLAGQERDARASGADTRSPLPTTTIPPGETTKRLPVVLEVDAELCARLDHDVLVDDRVPHDRVLADVDAVACSTEPSTWRREWTWTPGESTDRRTIPPETITPAQTIESTAMPVWPGSSNTNFAGGCRLGLLEDRPVAVVEVEDRVGRDQVHVGVVVGVERPDVAPVAVLALGRRPGRRWLAKSNTCASPRSTSIGMMSRADVVRRVLVLRVRGDRVDQRLRVEDVVAHRGEHLVGASGRPTGSLGLLAERARCCGRPSATSITPNSRACSIGTRSPATVTPAPPSRCWSTIWRGSIAVDVVGAEDADDVGPLVVDQVQVLVDRVGRAGEPVRAAAHLGRHGRDVVAEQRRELPGRARRAGRGCGSCTASGRRFAGSRR